MQIYCRRGASLLLAWNGFRRSNECDGVLPYWPRCSVNWLNDNRLVTTLIDFRNSSNKTPLRLVSSVLF